MIKLSFTILGNPITKKNSQRIIKVKLKNGKCFHKIMPSKAFEKYEKECKPHMPKVNEPISVPVNLKCIYYMKAKRAVDLLNLLEGTADILVDYGILADDNRDIVYSTDGSKVLYDKENPRVEVGITALKESEVEFWEKHPKLENQ